MLSEALTSVLHQTVVPDQVIIELDHVGRGPAVTRNQAWRRAETDWVAFLDDDDLFLNWHVEALLEGASTTGADLVYSQYQIQGDDEVDPFVTWHGRVFDEELRQVLLWERNFIPVTVLVRRELLQAVDGFPEDVRMNEDWALWRRLLAHDVKFTHVPRRTWVWRWHAGRCGGLPWSEHPYVRTLGRVT